MNNTFKQFRAAAVLDFNTGHMRPSFQTSEDDAHKIRLNKCSSGLIKNI